MDETPEELEQIRREADLIDPNQYRKRGRVIKAIAFGALGAAVFWGALELTDRAKNPCQRVRDHFCRQDAKSPYCASYDGILKESVDDPSNRMRSMLRDQCLTKINRLKEEEHVIVR
jgi:hypothetical protein